MLRKVCLIILAVVLCMMAGMAGADGTTISVGTKEELLRAVETINAAESGAFVISLTADIETNMGISFNSDAGKTILGNGHTIQYTGSESFLMNWSGILNLGTASEENTLIIKGTGSAQGGDSSSLLQITTQSGITKSVDPVLNMYEGVVLKDFWADNSRGAGVRVYTNNYAANEATFNMYGGAIRNCRIISGYNTYGGGVHVSDNGHFNLYGGEISGCGAMYGGAVHLGYCDTRSIVHGVKPPEFHMMGGKIINNSTMGSGSQGGGVAVFDGTFTMSGGEISGNSAASMGGGILAFGPAVGYSGEIIIQDGMIVKNRSTSFGGGITSRGADVTMTGGILCNNTSTAAGDDVVIQNNGTLSLSSASAMNQKLILNGTETRYSIDGWYFDYGPRWSYDEAFKSAADSANEYLGDTTSGQGMLVKAAFTAYDQIDISKTWEDGNDLLGKRPDSLTFTLVKANTLEPVLLRVYDESAGEWLASGAKAEVTLTQDSTTGSIWPLVVDNYSDSTKYLLQEEETGEFYQMKEGDPVITFTADTLSDGTKKADSGVYAASFTNTARVPVTLYKIWDDANNLDQKRPDLLNVDLRMNGARLTDFEGKEALYGLTAEDGWQKKVYLPAADYTELTASEGTVADYTQVGKTINQNEDGSYSVIFINKHTLVPAAADTVRNENMVEIHYQAEKKWQGSNPVGDKMLPHPEVTVILYADGVETAREVIAANADPATAVFYNVPKYRDNDGNDPIAYTIKEEITDSAWVKVGDNLWYSLDGMGKYEGSITDVTVEDVGSTEKLTTLTGGTATNTYTTLQTTTTVEVTKLWKDHQNENGVRPKYLKVGLFKNVTDTEPAATVTLTGPISDDYWTGTFTDLPIYDADGKVIDYKAYVVKEAYPAALNTDGTPASWDKWVSDGEYQEIKDDHDNTFKYEYSTIPNS